MSKYDAASVIKILIERDGMTRDEAKELLEDCREMVLDGEDPEDVLYGELGLDPDYIFALMG